MVSAYILRWRALPADARAAIQLTTRERGAANASKSSRPLTTRTSIAAKTSKDVVQLDFIVSLSAVGFLISLIAGPRDPQTDHCEADQGLPVGLGGNTVARAHLVKRQLRQMV